MAELTKDEWNALIDQMNSDMVFMDGPQRYGSDLFQGMLGVRQYDKEALTAALNYLGFNFEPIERASYYTTLQMILDARGTIALNDHELALLAWAPNDNQASQAVEAVRDGELDAALYGGNPNHYLEYVSHHGSVTAAQNKILDADGWVQPGGWARIPDIANRANIVMANVAARGAGGLGDPTFNGMSMFGDSRLWPIIESTYQVRRSEIEVLQTEQDVTRQRVDATQGAVSVAAEIYVGTKLVWRGAKWLAPHAKTGITIAAPWIAEQVPKIPGFKGAVQAGSRFINTTRNVLGLRSNPTTQGLMYTVNRTGMNTREVLMRLGWRSGSNLSTRNLGAIVLSIGGTIAGLTLKTMDATFNADEYDKVRIKRLKEQEVRQGITPEEQKELDLLEEKAPVDTDSSTTIPDSPEPTDKTFNRLDKSIAVDPTPSLTFTEQMDEFLNDMDDVIVETDRRMSDINAIQQSLQSKVAPRTLTKASMFTPTSIRAQTTTTTPDSGMTPEEQAKTFTEEADKAIADIIENGVVEDESVWSNFLTENELRMQGVMDDLDLEFYDPETMPPLEDLNEGFTGIDDGWTLFPDVTAPKGDPRYILLPPNMKAAQFDQYFMEWEDPNDITITDPLIRVPEGYSARTFQPEITNTGTRPGEFDNFEARFIGQAQGFNVAEVEGPGVLAEYRQSAALDFINGMSFSKVLEFQKLAGEAGFYGTSGKPFTSGYMTTGDQDAVLEILGQANVDGEDFWEMLNHMAESPDRYRQETTQATQPAPASPSRPAYSVPTSLRTIPGPKSIAAQAKSMFEQKLGRQARPDELAAIAQEMTGTYNQQNQELIALDMARYNGSNEGMITGAQFKAIEDPEQAAMFNIEDKWKNEINLNERREANASTFQRMLNATLGNRPSIGDQTAAGNVQQIGRM